MVSSGYSTEATFESIWETKIESARFNNINVRLGGLLNLAILEDGATDTDNTAIIIGFQQMSDEIIISLMAAAKIEAVHDPWDFMQANVMNFFNKALKGWEKIIKMMKNILGNNKLELTTISLPAKNSRTY